LHKEQEHIDAIIMGCRNGDRKAQEHLYRNYYKAMMSLCVRYTRNETDAMSVLNIGFLKVFRNIQRYDPNQASLYTWIRTVVVNSCLDHIKTRQKDLRFNELNEAAETEVEPEIESRMKEGVILELVRQLPPATRAVFNLYVMEGYGHKEVGILLNISEGTSKWHLSEAKKKLKTLLQQEENK
jgi:RNA polymerase sigma-70 factor (ECF subfamily)